MNKILAIVVILIAAVAAYVYIFEPETLEKLTGGNTSDPVEQTRPSRSAPTTKSPQPSNKPKRATKADLVLPPSDLRLFVNGEPVQPGETRHLSAGTWVINGLDQKGNYIDETITAEPGGSYTAALKTRSAATTTSWDSFQGNGHRTGFVRAANRDTLKVRWQTEIEDKVKSSPVIFGDTAYFSSENRLLNAVDLNEGELRWTAKGLGSHVSPVANETHVFMGNDVGLFNGYRIKDGKKKGSTSLNSYATSLALIGEEAFLATTRENDVVSIKTKKGLFGKLPLKINWQVSLSSLGGANATPLLLDGKAIFVTETEGLVAISLRDGSRIWPKASGNGSSGPLAGGQQMSLALVEGEGFLTPTPAADRKTVYAVLGKQLVAVSTDSGEVAWRTTLGYTPSTSLSLAYGLLYLGDERGRLHAHSAATGAASFAVGVSERSLIASPVVFRDKVLVATQEGLVKLVHCFSGKLVAENDALQGAPILATPAVDDQAILVVNKKGRLVCFE